MVCSQPLPFQILQSMDSLTKHWSNLSLNDREGDKMPLRKERSSAKFIIVAKFLTSKALNIDAIIRTFNPLWRTINGFKARNVGDHVILFIFDDEEEVENIFRGELWSFDKHLVVLEKYEKHSPVHTLSFSKVFIWVQIHDIPVCFMNKKVAEDLGTVIGEVDKTTKLAD